MNYGVIGNCKSAALIDPSGAIVWACLPNFDSVSVFASILDSNKGGSFGIVTDPGYTSRQKYIKNTNILETEYSSGNDIFRVLDFMPRHKDSGGQYHNPPQIIRLIRRVSGNPSFSVRYDPKPGYAQYPAVNEIKEDYIKTSVTDGDYESVYLYTGYDRTAVLKGEKIFITDDGYFLVGYHQRFLPVTQEHIQLEYEKTKVYWLDWIQRTHTFTHYLDDIRRSALVLKLLSNQESGALLAAVTTSLPEQLGGVRNWDYRFCWIRDSSMILNVLTRLGHYGVARNFAKFLFRIVPYKSDRIRIMYSIRGQTDLTERTLDWLSGYQNSKPVRVGNAAYIQRQNDIYGVLLDVIYSYIHIYPNEIETVEFLWTVTRTLARTVAENWTLPDMGIWEFRDKSAHYVYSKVLCWVAVDRAAKIANLLQKKEYQAEWLELAKTIKTDILEKGWNDAIGTFTQSYGSHNTDASNLLFADYGFIEAKDPKFVSTVHATRAELERNGLMFRYRNPDDFGEPESSFTVCSFWLVKALWQIGDKADARRIFEQLLGYRNAHGLFSEDISFTTKELLGNFPQGYSHLALIDCAISIGEMKIDENGTIIEQVMGRH